MTRNQITGRRERSHGHARPFALAAGPPWRTRLVRLADDAHVLIVTLHHYVSDGISVQVWLDEVDAHYRALATGAAPDVPALTASPLDVASLSRRRVPSAPRSACRPPRA